jgi:F-type H+-transporting ATPase subunit b
MLVRQRVLIAGLLAGAVVIGAPSAAGASGETVGGCFVEKYEEIVGDHEGELTAEQEEELEAAAEDCIESPNPILPATNEIIWGSISFFIVFGLLAKFAFPALRRAMAAREERIREDLEAAERTRVESEQERRRYEEQIANAREEAGRIVEEARQAGEAVRADVVARAEQEAAEIRSRAEADVALQRERLLSELRGEVASMSIDLASRIVERNLDTDANRQLVDSFIEQVGRSN